MRKRLLNLMSDVNMETDKELTLEQLYLWGMDYNMGRNGREKDDVMALKYLSEFLSRADVFDPAYNEAARKMGDIYYDFAKACRAVGNTDEAGRHVANAIKYYEMAEVRGDLLARHRLSALRAEESRVASIIITVSIVVVTTALAVMTVFYGWSDDWMHYIIPVVVGVVVVYAVVATIRMRKRGMPR